jgi:hypothetical protein
MLNMQGLLSNNFFNLLCVLFFFIPYKQLQIPYKNILLLPVSIMIINFSDSNIFKSLLRKFFFLFPYENIPIFESINKISNQTERSSGGFKTDKNIFSNSFLLDLHQGFI